MPHLRQACGRSPASCAFSSTGVMTKRGCCAEATVSAVPTVVQRRLRAAHVNVGEEALGGLGAARGVGGWVGQGQTLKRWGGVGGEGGCCRSAASPHCTAAPACGQRLAASRSAARWRPPQPAPAAPPPPPPPHPSWLPLLSPPHAHPPTGASPGCTRRTAPSGAPKTCRASRRPHCAAGAPSCQSSEPARRCRALRRGGTSGGAAVSARCEEGTSKRATGTQACTQGRRPPVRSTVQSRPPARPASRRPSQRLLTHARPPVAVKLGALWRVVLHHPLPPRLGGLNREVGQRQALAVFRLPRAGGGAAAA